MGRELAADPLAARTADGVSWSFEDPALTTWELGEAARWLRRVADGDIGPSSAIEDTPAGGDEPDVQDRLAAAGWLTFTEPNLSLAVGRSLGPQVEVLVGLGHESASPPVDPRRPQRCEIALLTDARQVLEAAASFERDLAAFPAR
ncbi:MAG TPA: hypothetical protein VFL99_05850 [Segeticoccus sp.]|uniref:WapI family immunity protein n=1 Tax=Segeticoccus sp. TaxID=2706531 RepID=UPI002D7EA73F|nr:hypothetical protein [Segeticoccus sp.]HET8599828.1 hypothetical protein [Segeticoccus sp.]